MLFQQELERLPRRAARPLHPHPIIGFHERTDRFEIVRLVRVEPLLEAEQRCNGLTGGGVVRGVMQRAWDDDLSVVFFIWILFLANAFIVDDKKQIVFDIVFKKLKGRTRFVVDVFRTVLVLIVFAAATPGSLDYIHFLTRERTSALEWRLDWVYSCFGIFMIATIVRQVFRLGFLIKNSPQPFQK